MNGFLLTPLAQKITLTIDVKHRYFISSEASEKCMFRVHTTK